MVESLHSTGVYQLNIFPLHFLLSHEREPIYGQYHKNAIHSVGHDYGEKTCVHKLVQGSWILLLHKSTWVTSIKRFTSSSLEQQLLCPCEFWHCSLCFVHGKEGSAYAQKKIRQSSVPISNTNKPSGQNHSIDSNDPYVDVSSSTIAADFFKSFNVQTDIAAKISLCCVLVNLLTQLGEFFLSKVPCALVLDTLRNTNQPHQCRLDR